VLERTWTGHNGRVETSYAFVGGQWASELVDLAADPQVLADGRRWVAVLPYDAPPLFLRFAHWSEIPPELPHWDPKLVGAWSSSLDESAYVAAVEKTRAAIARGDVYQANVTRVVTAQTGNPPGTMGALMLRLQQGNPAPFMSCVVAPGVAVASASPELFLRRSGFTIWSSPIKGTAAHSSGLLEKDRAENTMIVDLVRNDLGRICRTGTVRVPEFHTVQQHPGLVHLVSTVCGELREDITWSDIFEATFPAGSITGAPKLAAMALIRELESVPRRIYCGALGLIEGDTAELAVTIRTFWMEGDALNFGTGAGITWGSDAAAEWQETQLKARRLISLATT
jgi:para-aminobenzoate synthetase component 1